MIIRNLDSDGDWMFGSGQADYLTQNPAIGLNVKTRLLSWLNDCFFDLQAGIDWLNRLGNKNQEALLSLDMRRVILKSFGVTGILTFDFVVVDRMFTATYTLETIFSKSYQDSISREI